MHNIKKNIIKIIIIILIIVSSLILYKYVSHSYRLIKIFPSGYPVSVSQIDIFGDEKAELHLYGYLIEKKGLENSFSKYFLVPDVNYSNLSFNQILPVVLEITDKNNDFRIEIDSKCINRYVTLRGEMDRIYTAYRSIKTNFIYTIESNIKTEECLVKPFIKPIK